MQGAKDLALPEERIGYHFTNRQLLERAVTHRSFSSQHNERLEFLGDSVLNCVVGYSLFLRDKHFTEGELSRVRSNLVCEKTLAQIARQIGVAEYLFMGEGEVKMGGRQRASIMADALEALFGAVFFEAGFEEAQRVVMRLFEPILSSLTPEQLSKDAKTRLQEFLQAQHIGLPQYVVVNVSGPTHAQRFECECRIPSKDIVTRGEATNRRGAEQEAAAKALDLLHAPPSIIQEDHE